MKKYFQKLMRYNHWANGRILKSIIDHCPDDQDILKLYSHLISAQYIWLLRIKGIPISTFPIWEIYNLDQLETMTNESTENWLQYLESHQFETFEEMIFYQNSQGKKFENSIGQIITHVANHSTHHRAQISLSLRQKDIAPPATDYIFYAREAF